jgi:hypothetical protein
MRSINGVAPHPRPSALPSATAAHALARLARELSRNEAEGCAGEPFGDANTPLRLAQSLVATIRLQEPDEAGKLGFRLSEENAIALVTQAVLVMEAVQSRLRQA